MKILILEDNKFDSDLAKIHLLKNIQDCQIDVASTIAEANNSININYDLALLDIKLPDGFGTDFLINLRKINKEIAIIMLTGSEDEEFIVTALKSGADDYIVKKEGYLLNLHKTILYNLTEKRKRNKQSVENINVLYLEHHKSDIDLTIRHFKKAAPQFSFMSISTAEQALELLDNWSFKPGSCSIILMDYNMPGTNAIELTKIIRQERKLDIPIVIVTGQGNEDIVIEALKFGADEYLVKRENYLNKLPYLLTSTYQNYVLENKKRELVESESNYRLLFENNPQPMWIYDIETLNFLEVNIAAVNYYGYSKEEFLSMNLKDIRPDEDLEVFLKDLKLLSPEYSYTFESRHIKGNGEIISVEISANAINFNGKQARHLLIRDISKRKAAEKQVQLLSTSVEQSPVSIIITDFDGNIEYANPKFIEISGYKKDEIIGNNPRFIGSGMQNKGFYKELWDTIKSGRNWHGEFSNKKKSGEIFWENAIIAPIKNTKGEITHFVSVKEDITNRKNMIDELILAKEKAEESDLLKTAFLASISHEIRTPLNAIVGFSNLIAENSKDIKLLEYSRIVQKQNDLLLTLITDIIEFAKIESKAMFINKENFNLNSFINDMYMVYELNCTPDVKLISKPQLNPLFLYSDKNKINQIITNLISNAIKFTPKGKITFGYDLCENSEIKFFVSDTGIGIPKDKQEYIFDRFTKLDSFSQGVGLGLSIIKNIVEFLGGRIWLESELGKGSTFYFTIPQKDIQKDKSASEDIEGTDVDSLEPKLKILIAEDNEISSHLISIIVKKYGKEIITVSNGKEAVESCLNNPDIDLILMDMEMPVMSGYQATREIRQFNNEVVIIAQTAYGLANDRKKAIESGCNDYLSKPIVKAELISLIQEHIIK